MHVFGINDDNVNERYDDSFLKERNIKKRIK